MRDVSSSSSTMMWFPKLPRTSDNYALAKTVLVTKDALSTESLPSSWLKVETLQIKTALVVNPSTEPSLLMKTFKSNTPSLSSFLWPTPDPTPMEVNSSLLLSLAPGSTENTAFSVKWSKDKTSSNNWRVWALNRDNPGPKSLFPTAEQFDIYLLIELSYIISFLWHIF